MLATGRNTYDHLIAKSNKRIDDETILIDPPSPIDLDYNQIIDFSTGSKQSVYVTSEGKAFAYGDDRAFAIGTKNRMVYQNPIQVTFDNVADKFISAKCGQIYTVYLTDKGFIIICSEKSIHFVPAIHTFEYRIVYISGSYLSPVAIDARGDFYIFSKNPSATPRHIHLQEPVYDICRCSVYIPADKLNTNKPSALPNLHLPNYSPTNSIRSHLPPIRIHTEVNNNNNNNDKNSYKLKMSFTVVVTVNGKLYANGSLNNNLSDFTEVYSMHGVHVKHIYGYSGHCIAISDDGHVYAVGDNTYGQIGDGTKDDRYEFVCLNDIKTSLSSEVAVSASVGGSHSLIITKSGKLFGFGSNERNQLFTIPEKADILSPEEINLDNYIKLFSEKNDQNTFNLDTSKSEFDQKVTFAWCGNSSSIALIGKRPPIHLGFAHFFGGRESLAMQLRKISSTNIENLERQISQLKKEVQLERDQNKQLQQEKQKLQDETQQIKIHHTPLHLTSNQKMMDEKMKNRMEMRLCDIFNENDNLAEQNSLKTREIENLKRENEKLRAENEALKNEIQKSIPRSEYEKESNFRNNENAKLRKELEEKNAKIANLMNDKDLIITKPVVPHFNINSPHNASKNHSSAKAHPFIQKPLILNKK